MGCATSLYSPARVLRLGIAIKTPLFPSMILTLCTTKQSSNVTVTFDDCFVVHNIKIIEGKTGVFIAMPSRKTRAGEYKDVAHPIHPEFRAELQKRILEKYDSGDVDVTTDGAEDL